MYDVERVDEGTYEVSEVAGFGPDGLPRALVLTFDNLGEASELERATWPESEPLGRHPSVTVALPGLLDELDAQGLRATFFVEAINCELYPDALLEIARRGHELGMHGWRHEAWVSLSPERERELLVLGAAAFAELGLEVRAFRPPGGELTASTEGLLRELGYAWYSPAGSGARTHDGLALVPFDWELVDAYHLMERFGELRGQRGDGAATSEPAAVADRLARALATGSGVEALILHPFLMLDEDWFQGVRRLLAQLATMARERRAWVGPGGQFAASLRAGDAE
jgi:peptidoglycan/xylan/chitin deacetylase (PgdA/CDA1 family)